MKNQLSRIVHAEVQEAGAKSVAAATGLSHVRLLQKTNPDYPQSTLNIEEYRRVLIATGSYLSLDVLAASINRVTIPIPEAKGNELLLSQFLAAVAACGALGEEIKAATDSNSELGEQLSRKERLKISKEIHQLLDAGYCLLQAVQADEQGD